MATRGSLRASLSRPGFAAGTGKKRLTARCRWHFGGGPDYCGSCADANLPCAQGKANAEGALCPYAEHELQSAEAWEAWDIALRCAGQLRMTQFAVIGMDFTAAMRMAEALGYDLTAIASLLTACEDGMAAALNEKISAGLK